MGLLSKKDTKLITDPLADNNPITIQVLGICSALAITAQLEASIVMAVSVIIRFGSRKRSYLFTEKYHAFQNKNYCSAYRCCCIGDSCRSCS